MGAFTCGNVSAFRLPTSENVSGGVMVLSALLAILFFVVFLVSLYRAVTDISRASAIRRILKHVFRGNNRMKMAPCSAELSFI